MTMFQFPYGDTQQLNLDWFIKRWQEFYEEWQATEAGIDGALDAEVEKVEAAMSDLYAARDAAAASATAAAASAASASDDATIAANAATAAAASATLANTKATAAGLSEAAAALSASQASNDATAAATSASQASASASSATDSAQAAATSEQNIESIIEDAIQDATDAAVAEATADAEAAATAAAGSASDAADSATAAAASATAADSSADDAADSATAAAGSATAAAGSASDAADSATAAAASAASIVVDSAMSDSSTNPVQNKVINGELTELKTAIDANFVETTNLVTLENLAVGHNINTSGEVTNTQNYSLSDYIPIEPSGTYYFKGISYVAVYKSDKTFRTRVSATTAGGTKTFNANDYFIRVSSNKSPNNWQINKGSTELTYTPPDTITLSKDITVPQVSEKIRKSTNLANTADSQAGKKIDTDGTIIDDGIFCISDYISVKPNTHYIGRGVITVALYGEGKVFKRRVSPTSNGFDTNGDECYLRISSNKTPEYWWLNEGSVLLPYEPNGDVLEGLQLEPEIAHNTILSPVDRIVFSENINNTYICENATALGSDPEAYTSAEVYALWDDFAEEHSDYFTVTTLGEDDFGNTIKSYKFSAPKQDPYSYNVTGRYPSVFIVCSIHGYEKAPPFVMYQLFKQMFANVDNPILSVLKDEVDITFIPVANPSGWNADTRKNGNGIDLARNFPYGWTTSDPSETTYGGIEPLSEKETQYIYGMLEDYKFDACIDFHDFGSDSAGYLAWADGEPCNLYALHLAQIWSGRCQRLFGNQFATELADYSNDWYVRTNGIVANGQLKGQARVMGVKYTTTFEVCGKFMYETTPVELDVNHTKVCLEALINLLTLYLSAIEKDFSRLSPYDNP